MPNTFKRLQGTAEAAGTKFNRK